MIENMIFTSYSNKSYFVCRKLRWICHKHSNMSHDKLKHQIKQQFLTCDKVILQCDINLMSHRRLCYTMTGKQADAATDSFLV